MCTSRCFPPAGATPPLRGLVGFPPRSPARRGAAVAFAATDAVAAVAHGWPACLPLARAWLLAAIAAIAAPAAAQRAGVPDHGEFSAWLEAPCRSGDARPRRFVLTFEHPAAAPGERVDCDMAPGAGAPLAWDIYLGNLHSRTGHGDGGVPVEHCYHARLTQDDGSMLWSAPIWVTQQAAQQR